MRSRFRPILVSAIAAAACALIAAGVASAAGAGSLDTSFGSNGIVVDQWGQSASPSSDANQAVFQSDGSIVVAGEASTSSSGYQAIIARYTNSGSHDNGFGPLSGVAGAAAVSFGSGNAHGVGVALDNPSAPSSTEYWLAGDFQPSGGGEDFALAKVKHDGSGLDTSFGINGIVTTAPSAFGANITNVQPVAIYHYTSGANTGDTLIVGTAGVSGGESDFAIARYTSSGTGSGLDTTFNPTGPVPGTELISFDGGSVTSSSATATATFVDPTSGVIVVVGGIVGTGISAPQMAAARLKADGGLDTTFQTNGFGHYPVGSATAPGATALAIDSDGSGGYILGGHAVDSSGNQDFALLHLDSTGAPVTSWQSGGSELSTPSQLGTPASIQSLRVSGGDIIAAGYATPSATNTDFAIARYTLSSGAPDTTFGTNGFTTTAIAGSGEFAQALSLAVDPSTGNYLAAGYAVPNGGNTLLAMARYLASGSGGGNNYQVTSVNANPPSLQAGSNTASTITAKVTNNGSAVSGVQVDFTVSGIGCGANPASATTANGQGGTTLGQASTTYTVGTGTGSCTVTATVHGTSASNATSVNQTAPPPSYQISVGANPSSLPAGSGQSSFVTATVTNNGSNVSGDTVYFAVHGTGCGTLSSPDGSGQPKGSTINGQVKITYQVGSTPGNCTITAQETNTGATGSTTITQTGDLPDASLPGAILGDYNATTNSYALVLYDQLSPHGTPTCVDFQLFSSSGQLIYQSAPQGPDSSNGNPDTLVSKTIVPVGLKFAVLVHYWTPNSGGCSSGTDYDTARVYFTIPGPPPSASLVGQLCGRYSAATHSYKCALVADASPHGTPVCADFQLADYNDYVKAGWQKNKIHYYTPALGPVSSDVPHPFTSTYDYRAGSSFAVRAHLWKPNGTDCTAGRTSEGGWYSSTARFDVPPAPAAISNTLDTSVLTGTRKIQQPITSALQNTGTLPKGLITSIISPGAGNALISDKSVGLISDKSVGLISDNGTGVIAVGSGTSGVIAVGSGTSGAADLPSASAARGAKRHPVVLKPLALYSAKVTVSRAGKLSVKLTLTPKGKVALRLIRKVVATLEREHPGITLRFTMQFETAFTPKDANKTYIVKRKLTIVFGGAGHHRRPK